MVSEKNKRILVTFSKDEDEVLEKIALSLGISRSGLIHQCTMTAVVNAMRMEELDERGLLTNEEMTKIMFNTMDTVKSWNRRKTKADAVPDVRG